MVKLAYQQLRREQENAALIATGFALVEGDLWEKDGVCFGREAALQNAWKELPANAEDGFEGTNLGFPERRE
jgi:hypothetical protein